MNANAKWIIRLNPSVCCSSDWSKSGSTGVYEAA
jgi:hypothetical protein